MKDEEPTSSMKMWCQMTKHRASVCFALGLIVLSHSGCTLRHSLSSAGDYARILWNREPIVQKLQSETLPPEDTAKLQRVLSVLTFAEENGFQVGGSYSSYADIGSDPLAWVLVAARPTRLAPKQWWFPIVGTVPYLGFAESASAQREAATLIRAGWEASVRPTDAFSTLGWFDDPVLSTMLRRSEVELSELILHELTHRTVWVPGSVPFNESLAHFVGLAAAEMYAEQSGDDHLYQQAKLHRERSVSLALVVDSLRRALVSLFESAASDEVKVAMRDELFMQAGDRLKQLGIERVLATPNNAEFLQLALYCQGFELFDDAFTRSGRSLPKFFEMMQQLQESKMAPFDALSALLGEP